MGGERDQTDRQTELPKVGAAPLSVGREMGGERDQTDRQTDRQSY